MGRLAICRGRRGQSVRSLNDVAIRVLYFALCASLSVESTLGGSDNVSEDPAQLHSEHFPYTANGYTSALDLPPWGHANSGVKGRLLRDVERFQEWVYRRQHPSNCETARIYDMAPHPYGFASQLHVVASSMLEALAGGYVFTAPWRTDYVNKQRCVGQSWECLFKPFTNCTENHRAGAEMRNPPGLACSDSPKHVARVGSKHNASQPSELGRCQYARRKTDNVYTSQWWYQHSVDTARGSLDLMKRLAGVKGNYGTAFYTREAIRYITRPNDDLKQFTKQLRSDIAGLPLDMSVVIGVHIRRGDAATRSHPRWDVNDYADAFRAMLSQHGGFTHMLLSSDDKNVYSNMEAAIQHVAANREDPRRHVLPFPPQDESTRIVHIPMGYWRVMNGNENMPAASRITAAYNVASNHSQVWDESMLLAAQAFLFGNCGGFIGTMDSNIARLVWEFMSGLSSSFNPNVFDMNGGLWYPGWEASRPPYRHLVHHLRRYNRAHMQRRLRRMTK